MRPRFDALPTEIQEAVIAAYSTPVRRYHTLDHAEFVVERCYEFGTGLSESDLRSVEMAGWFHDAVYDSRRADNESRSAELALNVLPDMPEVASLILVTAHHKATTPAEQVLVDADLAILGSDATGYEEYARAIRAEYAWVPEEDYRAGRADYLQGLLDRPHLFGTEIGKRLEPQARANIAKEIEQLTAT